MRRLVGLGVVAAVLVGAALAYASTTIHDPNDTKGPIDIKSVKATSLGHGKWKFVIGFYGKVPPKGNTGNEDLQLWNKKPKQLQGAPPGSYDPGPYTIQGPQTGSQPVTTGGHDQPVVKHGTAHISRQGKTLTIVFSLKSIGSPKRSFYWNVVSGYYGPQSVCGTQFPNKCFDMAPNRGKLVKQPIT
jgi:hypothetical protein